MSITCDKCSIILTTYKSYLSHINKHFNYYNENKRLIRCPFNNEVCRDYKVVNEFNNYKRFVSHLQRKHNIKITGLECFFNDISKENIANNIPQPVTNSEEVIDFNDSSILDNEQMPDLLENDNLFSVIPTTTIVVAENSSEEDIFDINTAQTQTISDILRERSGISSQEVNNKNISAEMNTMFLLKWKFENKITGNSFDELIMLMSSMFSNCNCNSQKDFTEIKESIGTEYLRNKVIESDPNFIKANTKLFFNKKQYYYVSIIDTLNLMCKDVKLFQELVNDKQTGQTPNENQQRVYKTFRDGSAFVDNNNELFLINLRLEMNFDDFCVRNPLGPASKAGKMCAVYWSINNLPLKYQSSRLSLILTLLAKRDDISSNTDEYLNGFSRFLYPLIRDLKTLEDEGFDHEFNGDKYKVKVNTIFLTGDGLAKHEVLGLKLCFSSSLICTSCYAEYEHINVKHWVANAGNKYKLKTHAQYKVDLHAHYKDKSKGKRSDIKERSHFYILKSFNLNFCVTPDVAHTLTEGVIKHWLTLYLNYVFDTANKRMSFLKDYKALDDLRCGKIRDFNPQQPIMINGTIDQIIQLFVNIPRLLPLTILEDKDFSLFYGSLKYIFTISYADKIMEKQLVEMEKQIKMFYKMYEKYFPTETIIPKMHWMSHFPAQIRAIGPLVRFDTLRYERRHQTCKQINKSSMNSQNLPKSLFEKNQRLLVLSSFPFNIVKSEITFGKLRSVNKKEFRPEYLELNRNFNVKTTKSLSDVTIDALCFHKNFMYLVRGDNRKNYQFYHLIEIFKHENQIFLICLVYDICKINKLYHRFELKNNSKFDLLNPSELITHRKFNPYMDNDENSQKAYVPHTIFLQ